jgi:transposase-like protein
VISRVELLPARRGRERRRTRQYAVCRDARWARTVENVSALVAYGIGLDGHRQLLAVTIGAEESEDS